MNANANCWSNLQGCSSTSHLLPTSRYTEAIHANAIHLAPCNCTSCARPVALRLLVPLTSASPLQTHMEDACTL